MMAWYVEWRDLEPLTPETLVLSVCFLSFSLAVIHWQENENRPAELQATPSILQAFPAS